MINENEIVYGTMLAEKATGVVFKIIGGTTIKGEQCYQVQPLVANQVVLKDWVLKNCDVVKQNDRGIPIEF